MTEVLPSRAPTVMLARTSQKDVPAAVDAVVAAVTVEG